MCRGITIKSGRQCRSLRAQREACEAFIDSQRHEGWVCLRAGYDDGGCSGATMERPSLQQLLADITAGRVDIVVVYKIDRLTRSLADFAKISDRPDAGMRVRREDAPDVLCSFLCRRSSQAGLHRQLANRAYFGWDRTEPCGQTIQTCAPIRMSSPIIGSDTPPTPK
jgi:hypothetical protein